jgi:hypothetical protein
LGKIPGPWHASLTGLIYFIKAAKGEKIRYMQKAHRKYGPLVRIGKYRSETKRLALGEKWYCKLISIWQGPKTVSVGDPQALRKIHGSHKFTKTSFYDSFKFEDEPNVFSMR